MDDQIRELARKRNAIILVHNYQPPEIQDIADVCGDSLELSIRASRTDADVIVFCGVHFMAETASILCPDKTVLLPKMTAGCPMADMITASALEQFFRQHPPMPVITYVNSSASVKALSTICCTSANAVKVVESLDESELLMVPDRNLAKYTASRCRKKIHFWDGYCPIHDALTAEHVNKAKATWPNAVFMVHPECRPEVIDLADVVLSTSGMLHFAKTSGKKEFIVGTETGILYPLSRENPDKKFYSPSVNLVCADMKKIGLDDVIMALETLQGEVKVPESIRKPALTAVQRMIDLK